MTTDRRPGGPITGPNVLSKMTLRDPGDRLDARSRLFAAVLSANPNYLPGVSSGSVSFKHWYRRKAPHWVRVAETPAGAPDLVGHVAVRLNGCLPDGRLMEDAGMPRHSWELGMLVVHPGFRGCDLASEMIRTATATYSQPLWSVVHADSPGHRLLSKIGWSEVGSSSWRDEPGSTGVVFVSPRPGPLLRMS